MARGQVSDRARRPVLIDLTAAFERVVHAPEAAEVPYLVVGSTAAAWGVARTTRDVDLVTVIGGAHLDDVLQRIDQDDI